MIELYDYREADSSNIHQFFAGSEFVGADADSTVRKNRHYAIKEYRVLKLPQARLYERVTKVGERVAPRFNSNIDGYGDTSLRATPILSILESNHNSKVYGISPYIDGDRGDDNSNDSWIELLRQFAVAVMAEVGVMGIVTLPSNSKMERNSPQNILHVTDICARISNLRAR